MPAATPLDDCTQGPGDTWRAELGQAQEASTALAVGRFTIEGQPLYLNRGMRAVLGGDTPPRARRDYLVNPSFDDLLAPRTGGLVFSGWLTVGDGYRMSRTLRAQAYRKGGEVLIVGEYDVLELDRLERETSRTNQEINNLQRGLLQKNARLAQTLIELEEQVKTLRDSEQRFRRIVEHLADPVMVTDLRAHIRAVNPAFSRITGYDPAEVLGRTPKLLASGHHPPPFYADLRQRLATDGRWQGNLWNRRKNGEVYVQRLSISSLRDSADEGLYIAVYNDIGAEIRALEQAQFQAEHDALTGLPNRVLLFDRLSEALRDAQRRDTLVGVLFIDLDRFKPINDTHGHATGDTVLQTVARRLKRSVRDTDSVARLGGDEFVVVLRDVRSAGQAEQVAHKVLAGLDRPLWLNGLSLSVGASIGIAIGPVAGETAEDLLHRADLAMYAVKRTHAHPHPLPGRVNPVPGHQAHVRPPPHGDPVD
ncbi:sensor domain-containing diguanylate cyclase [uncultured Thiodictyon sp.]|uniref:sensor domain-containing diguanylate cyclase n=1 Tax=uncultured Thiodictyon sp. TaxID=1846217 RepID=UPI0025DF48A1|nr:sensor domain-containing diguanylate cyclase [uncultured Thiodictyon sp.]